MSTLMDLPAWNRLKKHRKRLENLHLRDLTREPDRYQKLTFESCGLFVDFSKQRWDHDVLLDLVALAEERFLPHQRARMFQGEPINWTEERAVWHVALRDRERSWNLHGTDQGEVVTGVLNRAMRFATEVRQGAWKGATGETITDVVNIGIGGSDLGPAMVYRALAAFASGPRVHYVSNVDGTHLAETLKYLDPATTLFIVASKTFTTQETLTNARSARDWIVLWGSESAVARHFVAVSTSTKLVREFGIDPNNMFEFWSWVGGRYSLWSAIGLSLMVGLGSPIFEQLLQGAAALDRHFQDAPLKENLPVLLALVGVWNRNFLGSESLAVLPYDQHLEIFPAWLQQLDMESNGKRVAKDGSVVDYPTGPVVWGAPGTNGQHAFYQLLHQSPTIVATDFLASVEPAYPLGDHHRKLLANFLAQPEALAIGRTEEEVRQELEAEGLSSSKIDSLAAHKVFPGNRPSTSILFQRLDPETLGSLLALYEHKVYVQGVIWGLNSFDQWGVELGKKLAKTILEELDSGTDTSNHDPCTFELIQKVRTMMDG